MHRDHICAIHPCCPRSSRSERLASTMQEPFPAQTHLVFTAIRVRNFLMYFRRICATSSAPRHELHSIPVPALPRSASGLVRLRPSVDAAVWGTPSPEAMVTRLVTVTSLRMIESLDPLPPIPEILPRLNDSTSTSFYMTCPSRSQGVSLCGRQRLLAVEDIVSQIYNPVLDTFHVVFFDQLVFDIPQAAPLPDYLAPRNFKLIPSGLGVL